MSNYNNLKGSINNNIYENQTQQITGTVMNTILNEMTNVLGAGYQFAGVATVGMNPGGPDARVFYLAGEGIYTNFGNLQVPQGHLGILKWDSHWHLETIEGLGGGGANLTGYVSLASTDDLPDEGVATLGYLCGTNLYLYVGEGGDTKEGKYQNCGSFRGPQGIQGDTGVSVQSVVQTTTSTEDEGINIIICTLENGTQSTFQIKNGSKGSQGIQGPQGVQGEPGRLQAQYKQVETLPTASADTVDYIYLVESDTPNVYDMYYTEENQGAYSWQPLGTTAVQLSDYATKAEVSQLEAEKADKDMVRAYMMSVRAKQALLSVFDKVAFAFPDVSAEMDELENALFNFDEVVGIEATFTQGESVFYDQGVSTLDDLKDNLIVKAVYGDGTKVLISSYTLDGDLSTAGTHTITAYFLGYTDTFDVVVTHYTTQMVFTIADGDVSKYQGNSARQTNDNSKLGIGNFGTSTTRRVFLSDTGISPIKKSDGTSTGKYPIPVPRNAKKVTIEIAPSSYNNCGLSIAYLENGDYSLIDGYIYEGFFSVPFERSFTAAQIDKYRKGGWYFLATAATKSGNYGSSSEPTGITITFE